jgi:hypothetical protein
MGFFLHRQQANALQITDQLSEQARLQYGHRNFSGALANAATPTAWSRGSRRPLASRGTSARTRCGTPRLSPCRCPPRDGEIGDPASRASLVSDAPEARLAGPSPGTFFFAAVLCHTCLTRLIHRNRLWPGLFHRGEITLITNALDAGVPLRDAQILARHADPRTTEHYDRARANLDRQGVHFLTAYVAGV